MTSVQSSRQNELPAFDGAARKWRLLIALGVVLVYGLMVVLVLATHDWDPKAFVLERPDDIPDSQTWGVGYDGQHAYAIALDPANAGEEGVLDRPAYRYMRIVYPIATRILALGVPGAIPWSLLVTNLLAVGATAWLLADLAGSKSSAIWVVLASLLSLNYLIGMRLDLNEPMAMLLAVAGFWLYRRGQIGIAIAVFALSGLSKEVFLTFPVAIAIYETTQRRYKRAAAILFGGLIPYLAWSQIVTEWIGTSPFSYSLAKPSLIPFAGMQHLRPFESQVIAAIWVIGPAILAAFAVAWSTVRDWPNWPGPMAWVILLNVALIATLPVESWEDPLAILRLGLGAIVAGLLWLSEIQPRLLPYTAAIWVPSVLIALLVPGFLI